MEIALRISLFVFAISIGAFCSYKNIIPQKTTSKLLWIIFYFGLPITIASSILSTPLDIRFWYLPVIAIVISLISGIVALLITYTFHIPKSVAGVLVGGTMIMNTNFTVAFMDAWFGQKGVAIFSLFDIGNIIMFSTVVYVIMLLHGGQKIVFSEISKKVLHIPLLWVIAISLPLSLYGIQIPSEFKPFTKAFSLGLFTLVMFTLGLLLHRGLYRAKYVALGILLRYGIGALIGWWFVSILGIEGLAKAAIIIGAASPNGYTTLIYARMANLDTKYAASLVSTSIIVGLIVIPVLLLLISV